MSELKIKKNQIITGIITDLTFEGLGVCRVDGFPVFIENALPHETIEFKIIKITKRYAFGKCLKICVPSSERVENIDAVATRVGTMPLQHMSYALQLKFKQTQVYQILSRVIDIEEDDILPTIGMDFPWGYRNKAQIPVRMLEGVLETGFFKRGTHNLIPIENYYIQDPEIDAIILKVRDLMRRLNYSGYDEENHAGLIRQIIVRKGIYTDEIMIVIVTNGSELPNKQEFIENLLREVPNTVSIIQNVNDKKTNVIMGVKNKVLYGEDAYHDSLNGLKFKISAHSFFQVNTKQTEVLYNKVLEFADLKPTDTVIDAYCGIGSITLNLAKAAKHVYGVEVVPDAIKMAQWNAKENDCLNTTFVVGNAEDVMQTWVNQGVHADVVVVDPPRKGLDDEFIKATLETAPKRIVYVSCNPITLARNLKNFVDEGYQIEKVQPVDMFPQTTHVETIVALYKKD